MRYTFVLLLYLGYFNTNAQELPAIDKEYSGKVINPYDKSKWMDLLDNPNIPFSEVRKAFYDAWEGQDYEKHKGYKSFIAIEREMEGREHIPYAKRFDYLKDRPEKKTKSVNNSNWSLIGPTAPPPFSNNQGIGRINNIAFHSSNSSIYYVSAPTGGIWKTVDNGSSWTFISSGLSTDIIHELVIHPNNNSTLLAASQNGLYQTSDAGATWQVVSPYIFRQLKYNPSNPQIVYGLTNFGTHKSTDGGTSWTEFTDPVIDNGARKRTLNLKPNDPNTIYVTQQDKILVSTNAGTSFTELTLPANSSGDIYAAVTPDNPNVITYITSSIQVYKSSNNGNTWTQLMDGTETAKNVNGANAGVINNYFWFYNQYPITINPQDEDEIIVGNVSMFRTQDNGATWVNTSTSSGGGGSVHVDMIDIAFHPITNKVFVGCDGGLYRHNVDGQIWDRLNDGLPVTQIYRVSVSQQEQGKYIIGNQDNGVMHFSNNSWTFEIIGDGMDSYIFENSPEDMIASTQYGSFRLSTNNGVSFQTTISRSLTNENAAWTAPLKVHPTVENIIYAGYESIWRSVDRGANWENLSGNIFGGIITHIDVSEHNPQNIALLTYSALFISQDGGVTWNQITVPGFGNFRTVKWSKSSNDLIVLHFYSIQKTSDFGSTWTNFTSGLPNGLNLYDLEVFDNTTEEYYVAGFGELYHKVGNNPWTPFDTNLPNTYVYDIDIDYVENLLVAATYGRGLWSSPLANTSNTVCFDFDHPVIYQSDFDQSTCGPTSLSTNENADGIQWFEDGNIQNNSGQHISIQESGSYYVYHTNNNCKSYASKPVNISTDCNITSCSVFNNQSHQGSGNYTLVDLDVSNINFADPIEFCVDIYGDISSSTERFSIALEDGTIVGESIALGSDCIDQYPTQCFQLTLSQFNTFTTDNILTIRFDPLSTAINPYLCDRNEICVILPYDGDSSPCLNNWNLYDNISGTFDDSKSIIVTDGHVSLGNLSILKAQDSIVLRPQFESQGELEISIENCNQGN